MTPEAKARQTIDALLMQAGWHVCVEADVDSNLKRALALRQSTLPKSFAGNRRKMR
jgi:type I restriction enzyme, R subunit